MKCSTALRNFSHASLSAPITKRTIIQYDVMGRPQQETQCFLANCGSGGYSVAYLPCLLASLAAQTVQDFEVIVTDNSTDHKMVQSIRSRCYMSDVEHIKYHPTYQPTCYHSAEDGARIASGEYVVFASDDSYYMPKFVERMLEAANKGHDLVLCEMVYDERAGGHYSIQNSDFKRGRVDKTGFLLNRSRFVGFPAKPEGDASCEADGWLIEQLVDAGVTHIKIPDVLVVHN